jgi:hypothetical protein
VAGHRLAEAQNRQPHHHGEVVDLCLSPSSIICSVVVSRKERAMEGRREGEWLVG